MRVTDYPQINVRLPRDARDKLLALSKLRKRPQWRLIVESVECYLRDLPVEERRRVEREAKARTEGASPRKTTAREP